MSSSGRLALSAALLAPWLLVWQGIDFTDQGLSLAHYRLFFAHPEAIGPFQHMWLTNAAGAAGEWLLGGLGVLGSRVLWAASLSACAWLAFVAARESVRADLAAFGALFAAALFAHRRETWFHYNTLTALAYLSCAAFLIGGILRGRDGLLFAAGCAAGASGFARLPNVLIAALGSTPAFAAWVDPGARPQVARRTLLFAAGFVTGAAAVLAAMQALGHVSLYAAAVGELIGGTGGHAVSHDAGVLAVQFARDQGLAFAFGAAAVAAGIALAELRARAARPAGLALAACATAGLAALLANQAVWHWTAAGGMYLLLGAACIGRSLSGSAASAEASRDAAARISAWVALLALWLAPIGSANGIRNSYVGGWLAAALVLAQLLSASGAQRQRAHALAVLLCGALLLESAHHAVFYSYRDGPKPRLVHAVADPKLAAQFTTAQRARVIGEALVALRARVAPGDLLLAHEGTSLFHYLLDTRPYGDRAWPMLEAPARLARALQDAHARHACLPVAVRALGSTSSFDWPADVAAGPRMRALDRADRGVIESFLRRGRYRATYRNQFFEISEPAEQDPPRRCR